MAGCCEFAALAVAGDSPGNLAIALAKQENGVKKKVILLIFEDYLQEGRGISFPGVGIYLRNIV